MSEPLTEAEKRACLKLARQSLEHYYRTGDYLPPPAASGTLKENRGAFVTLSADGELRGCIGYPLPVKPLDETIIEMAVAAATQDPRFEPVSANEL
ncbi:MAG TPA: AMMECR1 domain-containing protein, partial [Acidobacteriota bacterium]|nr:AMMECR1 domain-containing protein [Acidobacteriota bacterium]